MPHDPGNADAPPVARRGVQGKSPHERIPCGDSTAPATRTQQVDRSTPVHLEPATLRAHRMVPFGREVEALVATGRALNIFVYAGRDAWDRAKARRGSGAGTCLVLPWGEQPTDYRWPRCPHGVTCDARGRSYAEALEIGRCIVSGGTPLAFIIGEGFGFPVASPAWRSPFADRAEAA